MDRSQSHQPTVSATTTSKHVLGCIDSVYESAFIYIAPLSGTSWAMPITFYWFLFITPTLPLSPYTELLHSLLASFPYLSLSFLSSWCSLMTTYSFSCIICLLWSCWVGAESLVSGHHRGCSCKLSLNQSKRVILPWNSLTNLQIC